MRASTPDERENRAFGGCGEVQALARQHTGEAIETLVGIVRD
jgi:hypothetical protein